MESTGDMDTALKFYQQAADPLSLVRVYCYCGNPDKVGTLIETQKSTCDMFLCCYRVVSVIRPV